MVYSTSACLLPFLVALACTPGAASGTPAGDGAAIIASPSPPSPGAGPSKQTAAPAPGSQPASVAQDAAEPYFGAGAARQAREHFALESWKAARDGFAAYLAAEGARIDRPTRARAELLLAIAESNLGEWTQAATHFEAALAGLPLLADYIHYQAARARFFARDGAAAMAHARKVAADSIVGAEAELLIGDLLRGKKAHREVAAHYAAYLRERPRGMRVPEARFRLAQAYEATGKAVPDAFELYRQVTISAPLSSWATQSHERMDALARKLGAAERKRYATLSADELIERGMVYYDAMRNPLSEADFEQALAAPGLSAASRCVAAYHRANSMFKARDRTRAAPHFDQAISACKAAGNIDLHVKAAYQAGRSYAHIGKHETAVDRYQQAEGVSADHSYVDDARLRQAEEYLDMGEGDKMREVLASIPELYPQGDMRAEALWRLGWDAYQAGKLKDAIRWLEKQIEVMPIDNNYWAEGQAQYWMGRAYAKLKQPRKAVAAYRDAVIRYPLSYYSLLALNRLRESHKKDYQRLVAEIRRPPAGEDARAPAFQLKPRPEYGTPGFARALELMRLGLGDPAEAELRRLGLSVPAGKDEVTDADEIEKLWAIAFLYDRAGRIGQSHWMTRWHILDYKRAWPAGHNAARWRIAYPKGYWELLSTHAAQHGFPVELIISIVREESAFNPLLESYANAIGLTQMIFPTAKRFARGTGIEVTRDNLRDPDKNVTIGSRFLGFLWNKWDGQIMLLPPSYNAGEGAVTRWLKARGTMAADEWIESIKVDQARRYSKRVISSYFTYVYLERGEIPVIPNSIPRRLLPDGADKSTAGGGDKAGQTTSAGKSTKKRSKKSSSKRRAGKNKQSR